MKRPRFVVYEAKDGWRWKLIAANGRIIADSGEAYVSRRGCELSVDRTRSAAVVAAFTRQNDAEVIVLPEYPQIESRGTPKPH